MQSSNGQVTESAGVTRDFTVATFVVSDGRVLLLWHRKLRKWLPPGGHIEKDELPDDAAVREVREETGLQVELFGEPGLPVQRPRQLTRPAGIQVEDIQAGHQHIDFIYYARLAGGAPSDAVGNPESEALTWFSVDEMNEHNVIQDVRMWSERAIQAADGCHARDEAE